jgi:hypothetical protein
VSIARVVWCLLTAVRVYGQPVDPDRLLEQVSASADDFQREARNLLTTETLAQRCYRIPEHSHLAIGRAADVLYAQIVRHEIESEYRVGAVRSDPSGSLVEVRSAMKKDGAAIRTREAAQKAIESDMASSESQIQRKLLSVFTDLGLVDVATNYGLMLLAFTRQGMPQLEIKPVGPRYFGAEDAFVFSWRQRSGGLLEVRKGNTARRPLSGELWVRVADGMPLRITAGAEAAETKHRVRDDATVEFTRSPAGSVTPLLAIHRHFVDDRFLTENFFRYEPFRRFQVESQIQYSTPKK